MLDGSNLIYQYDGSFDGLLCCVFESYEKKEIPQDIVLPDTPQTTLLPIKEILTNTQQSERVLDSIPKKMGYDALDFVRRAFLTCLEQKERYILLFLRMGYRYGPSVMNMLADDVVHTLFQAVKHLNNESHLLKGFVRFSIFNGALVAEIEPKNFVLPLLTQHFCERYPEERFLIHDKTHGMALIYQPYQSEIVPIESLQLPEPDEEEEFFRELWRLFYKTIEIQGRHNPKCRMTHMPKRYWKYLTEFTPSQKSVLKLSSLPEKKLLSDNLSSHN
jgi:probable DNA metabolism protein